MTSCLPVGLLWAKSFRVSILFGSSVGAWSACWFDICFTGEVMGHYVGVGRRHVTRWCSVTFKEKSETLISNRTEWAEHRLLTMPCRTMWSTLLMHHGIKVKFQNVLIIDIHA